MELHSSEVNLAAHPEQVVGEAMYVCIWVDEYGGTVTHVLPVEVHFDVTVKVPVPTYVGGVGVSRPGIGVGQFRFKDE